MPTSIAWAKVSASIFSNRKIREAGYLGALVYIFVLTQNAGRGATGMIPAHDLSAWFVADTLRLTEEQAIEGIARAIKAGLVAIDGSAVVICGWDTEWSKRQVTEAERKRMQRARVSGQSPDIVQTDVPVETASPECPTGEEREEREETRQDAARALAVVAVEAINELSGKAFKSNSAATVKDCRKLVKAGITPEQLRSAVAHVGRPWVGHPTFGDKVRPQTLLQLDRVLRALDELAAGASRSSGRLKLESPEPSPSLMLLEVA